jgi:hypothetical protein
MRPLMRLRARFSLAGPARSRNALRRQRDLNPRLALKRAHNGARTVSCLRGSSVVMQTAREDRVPELSRRSALLGAAGLVIGAAIPQQASAAGSTAVSALHPQ